LKQRRILGFPGIDPVIAGKNGVDLLSKEREKIANLEGMPSRRIRCEIFFREPKQTHCRVESPPILGMSWSQILLLQMDKSARRLNQTLEVIGILRLRTQPEVFKNIVRLIVALLIPAAKKTEVARVLRNFCRRRFNRNAAEFFHQLGNSLAFVHLKFSFESAEMTGNRGRFFFQASVLEFRSGNDG